MAKDAIKTFDPIRIKHVPIQELYEHPERFCEIIVIGKKSGLPEYSIALFKLMKLRYSDFPRKLASIMLDRIVMTKEQKPAIIGKDEELVEIPNEIFDDIREIYIDFLRKNK